MNIDEHDAREREIEALMGQGLYRWEAEAAPTPTRSGREVRGSAPIVAKPRSGGGGRESGPGLPWSSWLPGASIGITIGVLMGALASCPVTHPSKAEQCREAAP